MDNDLITKNYDKNREEFSNFFLPEYNWREVVKFDLIFSEKIFIISRIKKPLDRRANSGVFVGIWNARFDTHSKSLPAPKTSSFAHSGRLQILWSAI